MLHALTGLRAFAALWVVAYHYRSDLKTLFPASEPVWPLFDAGYAGVDVFFVLSGFIISYTYLDRLSRWTAGGHFRFLWLRLARIYPVHLVTLLFFLIYNQPGPIGDLTADGLESAVRHPDFREQLLLVHAWGVGETRSWNYPSWSISAEWLAYLAFPLVALLGARVRTVRLATVGLAAALVLNVLIYLAIDAAGETGRVPMLRIVGEFAAGMFLFHLWRAGRLPAFTRDHAATVLAIAAVVATTLVATRSDIAPVVATPLYAGLILALAYGRGWLPSVLSTRWCVLGGELSYALYMTHAVSQRWLWANLPAADFTGDPPLVRAGLLLFYVVVIAAVTVFTYYAVEKPGRALMRSVVERRRAPLTRAEVPVAATGRKGR